jgi:ketosteroid isomerase-like protein
MKIPGLLALVGLALSLVAPTVAQPKDPAADPQTTQKIRAISQAYNEAVNRNDAAAVAALFTQDAVLVSDRAVVHGRQAIEKWYADLFEALQPKELIGKPEGEAPHLIGTAGDAAYETGEWSETGQGPNGEPTQLNGYFSAVDVREGEDWKILVLTYNLTPSGPAPTPAPPAGPGND